MNLLKSLLSFRWANKLSELAGLLSAAALIAATLIMLHSVFTRYLFGQPTVWQTETSIYLLIFVTFVGAAYGLKHHAHVGVDLLVEMLPLRARLVSRLVTSLAALTVVLAVAWTMGHTWWEAYQFDIRSPTALRAPYWIVYAILPIGMILVACQYLAFLIEAVQALLGHRPLEEGVALLGQGNAELAAATNVAGEGVTDEGMARDVGQSPAGSGTTGRESRA